jgi:hypothetical protein
VGPSGYPARRAVGGTAAAARSSTSARLRRGGTRSQNALTARWQHLLNLTYAVAPGRLEPHVPAGVELEVEDGRAFASVVAFDVLDTRALGVPYPGFRKFPELNLRFYVRRGETFARSLSGEWRSSPVSAMASPAWPPRVYPGERGS